MQGGVCVEKSVETCRWQKSTDMLHSLTVFPRFPEPMFPRAVDHRRKAKWCQMWGWRCHREVDCSHWGTVPHPASLTPPRNEAKQRHSRASSNCSSVLTAQFHVSLLGLLEDGKLAHTGVPTASAPAGMLNAEKRSNCGSQCANPIVHSMGATTQRQNGFRTTEVWV